MNEFKMIVAGGRDFSNYFLLSHELNHLAYGTYKRSALSIVSGMAKGADALGARFALENDVKLYSFPAEWDKYGKRAGFIRNEEMGIFADGLVAFWDGQSKGTAHMIDYMKKLGKPVHVVRYDTFEVPTLTPAEKVELFAGTPKLIKANADVGDGPPW